jgi:outer membrane protein TolC
MSSRFCMVLILLGLTAHPVWAQHAKPHAVDSVSPGAAVIDPSDEEPAQARALTPGGELQEAVEIIGRYVETQDKTFAEEQLEGEPVVLDVRACVDRALSANARISAAEDRLRAARARVGQAQSRLLPQAAASASYTHTEYNEPESSPLLDIIGGLFGGIAGGAAPEDDFTRTSLDVSQVLYTGGQICAAIRASEYLARSQEWQRDATLAEVEFEAKEAYYDAILAQTLIRVAEDSLETYERTAADAQRMFDVGMISNFELLRTRTEKGRREADLVAARNARRLAFANLRRVLYLPQDTPLVLEPQFAMAPPQRELEQFLELARSRRPELNALDAAIAAARQDVKRVKGQYLPQVGLSANYANTDGGGAAAPDGWTFSLGAEWDLYTGGRRKHETIEAEAQVDQLIHEQADVEQLVELDVTRAYIQIQEAMARVASERDTVDVAREGLRLARLRFEEGVGTQADVLDAELALTGAESQLVQALREYAVGQSSLDRAAGLSWYREEAPEAWAPSGPEAGPEKSPVEE